jgi:hypothetical protein
MKWYVAHMREMRNAYEKLVGKSEGSDHLGDLDADGRIILQEVLGRTNRLLSLIRHGPH